MARLKPKIKKETLKMLFFFTFTEAQKTSKLIYVTEEYVRGDTKYIFRIKFYNNN